MADPAPGSPPPEGAGRPGFRRTGGKQHDYAVDLFREAQANLGDLSRVSRILLELGRFYNPLVNGPIVDPSTRRRVLEALEAGRREEAGRLLDERLDLYVSFEPRGAGGGPSEPGSSARTGHDAP